MPSVHIVSRSRQCNNPATVMQNNVEIGGGHTKVIPKAGSEELRKLPTPTRVFKHAHTRQPHTLSFALPLHPTTPCLGSCSGSTGNTGPVSGGSASSGGGLGLDSSGSLGRAASYCCATLSYPSRSYAAHGRDGNHGFVFCIFVLVIA